MLASTKKSVTVRTNDTRKSDEASKEAAAAVAAITPQATSTGVTVGTPSASATRGNTLDPEKTVVKFKVRMDWLLLSSSKPSCLRYFEHYDMQTKVCIFWLQGGCPYQQRCLYAHGSLLSSF